MPPIPIIAPQPRRLLPQPTIIDPSTPVLPINLDDPFIVSLFVFSVLALSETSCLPHAVPHTGTQERPTSSPHVPNPPSPPYQAFSGSFSSRPSVSIFPLILGEIFFFSRHHSPRRRAVPSNDKWAVLHVLPAVGDTISVQKPSLRPV